MAADLNGRVIVVLGGTGGIGSRIVDECASRGASVAIVGHSAGPIGDAAVDEIRSRGGIASAYGVDVSDAQAVADLMSRVSDELGTVDGLVNCAAIMSNGSFLDTSTETWTELIDTDLLAVVSACRAVLPGMIEAGHGSIVNVSTRLADTGGADAGAYASVKAAVVTLTRSIAAEFGPSGVRANVVAPGTVATRMGRAVIESPEGEARREKIPLRRFVTADEVAQATVFLLGDGASGITGQTIRVNAGEFMG